ncbi:MAG: AAA family ATPase [Candidatus Syntropharchaeia archaeon]
MKIIAFVGLPGSGKTEASRVARELGIPVVVMGDVVREETRRRRLPLTDENVGGVGDDLRKKEGLDVIAKRCIPKIRKLSGEIVVIEGIRGISEVECFKKEFGSNFELIHIHSPVEMRYERIRSRKRPDDDIDFEAFKRRDERELGWGMDKAIHAASKTVMNDCSLDEFRRRIRDILSSIR